jgi:hypothetical protein
LIYRFSLVKMDSRGRWTALLKGSVSHSFNVQLPPRLVQDGQQ